MQQKAHQNLRTKIVYTIRPVDSATKYDLILLLILQLQQTDKQQHTHEHFIAVKTTVTAPYFTM